MAEELLKKEQLNYEEVEGLIGAPPHGPKTKISMSDWESFEHEDASSIRGPSDLPTSDNDVAKQEEARTEKESSRRD